MQGMPAAVTRERMSATNSFWLFTRHGTIRPLWRINADPLHRTLWTHDAPSRENCTTEQGENQKLLKNQGRLYLHDQRPDEGIGIMVRNVPKVARHYREG
jgi:hypothetical protein